MACNWLLLWHNPFLSRILFDVVPL
jgi:hypothetical protein